MITCLLVVSMVAAISPVPAFASGAAAVTPQIIINNKTTVAITVTLTGTQPYTIYALPGTTTQQVTAGMYKYSYKACGLTKKGTLNAKGRVAKLTIAACPSVTINIKNYGGTNLTINLNGPASFNFTVSPHSTYRIKIPKGTYDWTAYWCGGSKSGTHNFTNSGVWWFTCK